METAFGGLHRTAASAAVRGGPWSSFLKHFFQGFYLLHSFFAYFRDIESRKLRAKARTGKKSVQGGASGAAASRFAQNVERIDSIAPLKAALTVESFSWREAALITLTLVRARQRGHAKACALAGAALLTLARRHNRATALARPSRGQTTLKRETVRERA